MAKRMVLIVTFIMVFSGFAAHAADLLQLVPDNSAFVLNINLNKILATDAIKQQVKDNMAKQTPEQKKAFDDFVAKTGIDPFTSLKRVVIFTSGKVDPKVGQPEAGVLVDGDFQIERILETIKKDEKASKDVTIDKFEGYDAICGKTEGDGIGIFIDNQTAAVGSRQALKVVAAIKGDKAKNIATNENFSNLIKKVDSTSSLWGVGLVPAELKEQLKANPQAAPLAALNAIYFSFNYENDILFSFTGEVGEKASLEGVMTSLNGFLAMIKMLAGTNPQAAEVLNMIKVEAADTQAKITLNVSKAKLDEIRKKIEDAMKQQQPKEQPKQE